MEQKIYRKYRQLRRAIKFLLLSVLVAQIYDGITDIHPDIFAVTTDFIVKHGYPAEAHTVVTEDGYILTTHRIPRGRNTSDDGKSKPVVFLQHGLTCTSDSWVLRNPEQDLAFMLADAGFDVWLGNARGNEYSTGHVNLSVSEEKYWRYSWHEMGYYDLPAEIDYVLKTTGQKDLVYVGASMGTTMFFVMSSTRPEYNAKIKTMIALSPVIRKHKSVTFTQVFGTNLFLYLGKISRLFGRYQLFRRQLFVRPYFINTFCKDGTWTQWICQGFYTGLGGESSQINTTLLNLIHTHVAGSNVYQLVHFIQTKESGKFQHFDFGREENLKKYNQTVPPEYDLSRVTTPVYLHYSDTDILSHASHVLEIGKLLPNVVGVRRVPLKEFNHFDFIWGKNANRLLYDDVIKYINNTISIQ